VKYYCYLYAGHIMMAAGRQCWHLTAFCYRLSTQFYRKATRERDASL